MSSNGGRAYERKLRHKVGQETGAEIATRGSQPLPDFATHISALNAISKHSLNFLFLLVRSDIGVPTYASGLRSII
jgi:hypothetical protein